MKNKVIVLFEFLLVIFTIITKLYVNSNYGNLIICLFWIISAVLLYLLIGFRKDNNKIKGTVINITIIILLSYILLTYMSGLYFGFLKNIYSLSITNIIKNIYCPLIMIISEELIRHMISRKGKKDLVVLTILYCILDIVMAFNANQNLGVYKMFVFITTTAMPSLARNVLASYLVYKVSYIPGLIVRLYFGLYIYLLPIIPDIGNFFISVLGVLLPYIIYINSSKIIIRDDKRKQKRINAKLYYIYTPIVCFLIGIVILVSGVFRYHMIAVASGSMEPVFYRGDAVIYEKINSVDDIHKGDVIVFNHEGKYITHRIISIEQRDGKYYVQTKGDNNEEKDNYMTDFEEVRGIIKLRLKYIGYPTVWFSELIS